MLNKFVAVGALIFCLGGFVGCGPNNDVTVSEVDDSVVHTEEQMAEMEASNAADMMSKQFVAIGRGPALRIICLQFWSISFEHSR